MSLPPVMRLVRPPEDGINRMSVAMAFLPLGLWIFGFTSGLAVGAFCVVAGAVSPSARSRISEVRPVPWSMVLLHLVSAIVFASSYAVYLLVRPDLSADVDAWYRSVGLVSACVAVAAVGIQLALLYVHAVHAMHGEMDRRLHPKGADPSRRR